MATMNGSARPAADVTGVFDSGSGDVEGRATPRPNPEVLARAKRRTYTGEYKQKVLAEADAARGSGEIGAVLRRHGLYSSHLTGPAKWTYFYLYVILDVFSRYVVGWMVADGESSELAKRLIADTCGKQEIEPGKLTIHADRGSSMTSKPVAFLMADLGITKTHSRPHAPPFRTGPSLSGCGASWSGTRSHRAAARRSRRRLQRSSRALRPQAAPTAARPAGGLDQQTTTNSRE